jgi:hypothetical protein
MTEDDWLTKDHPRAMLEFVRGRASTRQLRYFGAACCRLVWEFLPDDRFREAVECVEGYAAGEVTKQVLAAAQSRARAAVQAGRYKWRAQEAFQAVARPGAGHRDPGWAAYLVAAREASSAEAASLLARPTERLSALGESVSQVLDHVFMAMLIGHVSKVRHPQLLTLYSAIIRDVFGNPFRPVVFDPTWRTEAAVALARSMYESRSFSAAPVLADALEDAGLSDAAVLGHLRQAGGHVRGCWCVDAVLGLS